MNGLRTTYKPSAFALSNIAHRSQRRMNIEVARIASQHVERSGRVCLPSLRFPHTRTSRTESVVLGDDAIAPGNSVR